MTTNALVAVAKGGDPTAGDVNQFVNGWQGKSDMGLQVLFPPITTTPSAPTATAGSSGNLSGQRAYVVTFCTGTQQDNGQVVIVGETLPGTPSAAVSLSSQISNVANIATGPTGCIARRVYTNKQGGSTTSGPWYLVATINDNSTTTFPDNVPDASLGAQAPSQNSTGTAIAGINALAHGPSLTALLHFNGSLDTSRGVRGTFIRASSANNPDTLANEGNNVPSYVTGKWGDAGGALSIWEGTTNLVLNSDFETFTSTATVFSDALTAGTTADPAWTVSGGSFTWSTSGATSAANGSWMTAGNSSWKPLQGSGGQNLALTAQATFAMPATVPTAANSMITRLDLYQDSGNTYTVDMYTNGNLYIHKFVGGTSSILNYTAFTPSASTTYTITLSIDHTGALTAKLYSGTGTGGTLLQTLTATDTSLSGGFLVGVGGDTGVVISGVSVTAPWADGWTIGGDATVAWSLTSDSESGKYAICGVGISGKEGWSVLSNPPSLTGGNSYTLSAYTKSLNGVVSGGFVYINTNTSARADASIGSNYARVSATGQQTTTANPYCGCYVSNTGTYYFDAIQLEQKSYATPYLRNDSTSSTATRAAETYTLPASLLNAAEGTIAFWTYEDGTAFSRQILSTENGNTLSFYRDGSHNYQLFMGGVSGNTSAPSIGTHLLCISWNETSAKLYIDGVLKVSFNATTSLSGASHLYVGSNNSSAQQWDSWFDDLHIFNTALTDAQIASLYNATQPTIDDLATPIAPDTTVYNQSSSSPDANDVYTTVTYTRRDGTTYMTSALSGTPPSGTSQYPTMTWTYYASDGVTQTRQQTFSLSYDASGKRTGVSMTN